MVYYSITNDRIELRYIVREEFGVNTEAVSSIGLNNKDFYHFIVIGDDIVVIRMKRGMLNRFRYEGMSRTNANFVNGVVNSKGNKYLLVGGKNPISDYNIARTSNAVNLDMKTGDIINYLICSISMMNL